MATVRDRDEEIVAAVYDVHRGRDVDQLEAPAVSEGNEIVRVSPEVEPGGFTQGSDHDVGDCGFARELQVVVVEGTVEQATDRNERVLAHRRRDVSDFGAQSLWICCGEL